MDDKGSSIDANEKPLLFSECTPIIDTVRSGKGA